MRSFSMSSKIASGQKFEITFLTFTFAMFALGLNSLMAGDSDPTALILGGLCLGIFIYIRNNK